MTNFKFISANDTRKALYYQLPKVLFESQKYIKMSNDSKIAYAMLKDRCEYSLQNNWIDSSGNIYFIFTTEELMQLLHVGNKKVAAIKKELAAFGLLLSKRMPPRTMPDGTKKGVPARLYLGQLDLTATDVFIDKKSGNHIDTSESVERTSSAKDDNTKEYSQSVQKTYWDISLPNQRSSESVKRTHNLEESFSLDTKRHFKDTEKAQIQDQILLDNFVEIMKDNSIATFIPERVLTLIKAFSSDYAEAQQTVKTIHNAKHKAEQLSDIHIVFEDIHRYGINAEFDLYNTLLKAYQKQKTEKVENMQNLIFAYVRNWFVEYPCAAIQQSKEKADLPDVSLTNWTQN